MTTDTTTDALALAHEALREAREFIDNCAPDWYLAKQRMLDEINAALSPTHPMLKGE